MEKTKVIAWYLPQYHSIPENDRFWGKGYTDWVAVRKAEPLFEGHRQPRVPLGGEYYDLSVKENVEWQAKLAREHGIYGFGIYHYWFNNETNLLTKPAEIIRDNKDIDINYFFAWDNANWKRSWSKIDGNDWAPLHENGASRNTPQVLVPYILGSEPDWEIHFNSLLGYFTDERYVKIEGKPVFVVLQYSAEIERMCSFWDGLARKNGFSGMYFIYKYRDGINLKPEAMRFTYEPCWSGWVHISMFRRACRKIRKKLGMDSLQVYDYGKVWRKIIGTARANEDKSFIYNAFAGYDDSPRRGGKGIMVVNDSPALFKKYFKVLYDLSCERNKPFLFVTAWNEWGEGAYLEPDMNNGLDYLEAMKDILSE